MKYTLALIILLTSCTQYRFKIEGNFIESDLNMLLENIKREKPNWEIEEVNVVHGRMGEVYEYFITFKNYKIKSQTYTTWKEYWVKENKVFRDRGYFTRKVFFHKEIKTELPEDSPIFSVEEKYIHHYIEEALKITSISKPKNIFIDLSRNKENITLKKINISITDGDDPETWSSDYFKIDLLEEHKKLYKK